LQRNEQEGTLDKISQMFRSPDLKTIGIHLDVPKGLAVKEARGVVQEAGLKAGDRIAALNGTKVWTFADLQYTYDKLARNARQVQLTVDREGKPVDLTVALPLRWWYSDIRYKQLTIDPRTYFESKPLTEADKKQFDLPVDGFASRVSRVDNFARVLKSHDLKEGDIIFGVDGVQRDEYADTAEFFIRLRKTAGESVTLDVLRDGKRIKMPLKTFQMSFRK
jgi:S1-C subfamily serine protease